MRLCVFLENLEMARFRRYRKYTRRSHVKWSSRILNISSVQTVNAGSSLRLSGDLTTNPQQTITTISQKYTVKNVWMQFNLESDNDAVNSIENLQFFILFIPQGYTISSDTPYQHPEWIMAQRFIGTATNSDNPGYGPLSIKTRLARTLDTGDSIKWLLLGINNGTQTNSVNVQGICRFNTKAN